MRTSWFVGREFIVRKNRDGIGNNLHIRGNISILIFGINTASDLNYIIDREAIAIFFIDFREDQKFKFGSLALDFHEGHLGIRFSENGTNTRNNTANNYLFTIIFWSDQWEWVGLLFEISIVFIERMSRKIKPHQITFPEKLVFFGNLSRWWLNNWFWNRAGIAHHAEEVGLARGLVFLDFGTISLDVFEVKQKISTIMEAVEGAGFNRGLPRFFIKFGTVDAGGKITDWLERTVFITLRNNDIFH